ncbi:hypothetical protein GCM10029964_033330 [Kibdelosporangium lantanae]
MEPAVPVPQNAPVTRTAAPIHVRTVLLDPAVRPEAVFDALYADEPYAFWLDGPVSVMGAATRVARAWPGRVEVDGEIVGTGLFDWLETALNVPVDVPDVPGFALGWVGYLGYGLKAECGGARAYTAEDPDAVLMHVDRAIVFDHDTSVRLLAVDDHWITETTALLAALPVLQPAEPPAAARAVTARHGRAGYLDMIAHCQDAIRAGSRTRSA